MGPLFRWGFQFMGTSALKSDGALAAGALAGFAAGLGPAPGGG